MLDGILIFHVILDSNTYDFQIERNIVQIKLDTSSKQFENFANQIGQFSDPIEPTSKPT